MALTRPKEKDAELARRLKAAGFIPVFVPVVAYISLPEGMAALEAALDQPWDWAVVTSPEAAARFLAALKGRPAPPVAALGAGTARVLSAAGVQPAFVPPKAYGRVLAETLPLEPGARVLWPTSARAGRELGEGLARRGARVSRLDVYTLTERRPSAEERSRAATAGAVMLGSPSAARAWQAAGLPLLPAAAIGARTAAVAKNLGFMPVSAAEAPGIEGWVGALMALFR